MKKPNNAVIIAGVVAYLLLFIFVWRDAFL